MRLDRFPMDQVANSRGERVLYAKYETDPNLYHEQRRRHGSLRQARYAAACGLKFPGRGSRAQVSRTIGGAEAFTVGISLLTGDVLKVGGEYPLVTLRADRTGTSTTDSFRLYLKRANLSSYVLGIKAIDGTPATTSDETFAVTVDTAYNLALRWNGTTFSVTDGTTTKSTTPAGAFTGPYYLDIGGDKFTALKAKAEPPVIANLCVYESYVSDATDVLGVRDPASADYYWKLDGAEAGSIISEEDDAALLLGYPAAPQIVNSALQFSSESGALLVEHSTDLDRFFQTALKSVADDVFTFYVKGTRGQEAGRNVVLLDYGSLVRVEILATNYVRLTYNGTTVTDSTTQITAGVAFEVYAGRDGANLRLQVATTETAATAPDVPYLDLARIPNLFVGAEEDQAADTHFLGSLTKLALWPLAAGRDSGADQALFYFDLTAEPLRDSSLSSVPLYAVPHTAEGGEPVYTIGPLVDGEYVAVEGGVVLGHSGPRAHDNALRVQVGSDASGVRVGARSFVVSNERAIVIDHERERARPLGLPQPGADATVQAVGTGALDGAYQYGYQFESADGTLGPVKRLQPVAATDGARVIVGSSDGNEGTAGSELDETFGRNYLSGDTPTAGDRFSMDWDGVPADGTYTTEVRARLLDITEDDLLEKVYHRGVTANDGLLTGNTLYFSTDLSTHSFNINANWTVQCVFEYQSPRDTGNPMTAFGLWGVGKTERLHGGISYPSYNQDFVAFFLDGSNDAGGEVSDWYQSAGLGRDHYGDGVTGPKLVVGIPRQERRESWYASGRRLSLNYALLTFSDDPTWTAGHTYDIIFKRSGSALTVAYRDLSVSATAAYTELTSRTMATLPATTSNSGKTVPAKASYTASTFFTGYQSLVDARDFHFGTAMDYHLSDVPFIGGTTTSGSVDGQADPAIGQVDQADYTNYTTNTYTASGDTNFNQVKPGPGGTDGLKHFHYRVWNRALALPDLERHALNRSAALDGEPLSYGIYIDLGCVVEVETEETDKLTDKASGMIWYAKNEAGSGAGRSPTAETLKHRIATTATLNATLYPLASFGSINASLTNADLKLYVSPYGDGSYTLATRSSGAFNLRTRIWSDLTADPSTTKLIGSFQSFISDFDQFKTFSFGLVIKEDGSSKDIGADSMAINGNTLFKGTIGATTNEAVADAAFTNDTGWIALGGFLDTTVAPTWTTDISEFRVWTPGSGPDVERGTDFRYVSGRVAQSEYANMEVYIKFQPEDEVAGSPVTLTNYGTQAGSVGLAEQGNADIVDTRTVAGSGTDPAPKIALPDAPFEGVTALVLCRSVTVPINDPDDDDEVQSALNAARGAPLYRLARVPAGTTHYVDSVPDSVLGFGVETDVGQVPLVVKAVFSYDGHLGLLTGDYDIWLSERGPYGWESFPNWLRHRVPVTTGGGPAVAAVEAGGTLFVFGNEWAVAVRGSGSAPNFTNVGSGCGAYSPRCATVYSNMAFAYNGTLWVIADGQPVNFGLPVQDLLPEPANARLSTSSELASLFLIDESTGVALRYHFPSQRWTVEERDAAACGDLIAGVDAWVNTAGAWAQGSTSVYGDDVNAGTATEQTGTVSGNAVTLSSGTADAPLGCRCTVSEADGTAVEARIVSITGSPSVVTFDDLTGVTGTVKIRYGAGSTGMLLDSGILDLGITDAKAAESHPIHLLQGTGWEFGRYAGDLPGDITDRTVLDYTAVATSDERIEDGSLQGRFQRVTLRNRIPEASRCTFLEFVV